VRQKTEPEWGATKLSDQINEPRGVILEILRLEHDRQSFQEADVLAFRPDLHAVAVLFYGSWSRALTIAGLLKLQ
jgi:hypothetical protein